MTQNKRHDAAGLPEEHYIVGLMRSAAKRGTEERYVLDEHAEAMLERALLDFADDPSLAQAIVQLFSLAQMLHDEESSPTAAKVILTVLARLRKRFTALDPERPRTMEDVSRNFNQLTDKKPAPRVPARPPPAGSVRVSAMTEFGHTRRRMRG
jgi:hypothetical protein